MKLTVKNMFLFQMMKKAKNILSSLLSSFLSGESKSKQPELAIAKKTTRKRKPAGKSSPTKKKNKTMPKFSKSSATKLATCHPDLQKIFNDVIKLRDCTIICGARTLEDQQKAFKGGFSKLDGIKKKSEHQISKDKPLSTAVDVLPYPIDWNDKKGHEDFARAVKVTAEHYGIKIVWGGDWKSFKDRPHWQLA